MIDPVETKVDHYLELLKQLDLRLVKAVDTHLHADHVTGLRALRDRTRCITAMGEQTKADVVAMRLRDGDSLAIEGLCLEVMYTPGHTDDSYSFLMQDRVFTGDTLLIRGTGRTDFQNGDPCAQYRSIFDRLLKLPDATLVYPGHDYRGNTVSTIAEERAFNPRLQVGSMPEYVALMNGLNLPRPKMIDMAVPANMKLGLDQEELLRQGYAMRAVDALGLLNEASVVFVDLRERVECLSEGVIPGSLHLPYQNAWDLIADGGLLQQLVWAGGERRILFYCAFGERSAMVARAAQDAGFPAAFNLVGGIKAWKAVGGAVTCVRERLT